MAESPTDAVASRRPAPADLAAALHVARTEQRGVHEQGVQLAQLTTRCSGRAVVALPASGQGVAVGDPAGPVPVAPELRTFDYYEVHPARGAVARVHVEWRRDLYNPHDLPEGVKQSDLQDTRVTQKEYADGTYDVVEDKWRTNRTHQRQRWVGGARASGVGPLGSSSRERRCFRARRGDELLPKGLRSL